MQTDKPLKFKPLQTSGATKEAVAALKAQLEMELKNIKQCAYKTYECTQLTLEGYNFCMRHILQDKNAPFKQCTFVYNNNGKRCHLPAPKEKKDSTGYCHEHALKVHLTSSKRGNRCQPPRTAEVLLHSVSHYIRKSNCANTQPADDERNISEENGDGLATKCLDPFVDIDANAVLASGSEVLDMCSESESDIDGTSYGSIWHDAHADSSDNDSIDSEQEDILKHANIYSAEEVTLITRDKLIRLQSLYIDQFRYLTHMLRERRRRYLYAMKREKESCCSIYNQIHDTPKEQRMYKKLKAYNSYHKKHGIEAVCHKRLLERRMKANDGVPPKTPSFTKCIFTEGGVKCGERALPVTRHCRKHILEDPNQVLFRACGKMGGDIECTTPVEAIFDDTTCRLHMDIPSLRSYSQIRKDSESDYEESLELNQASTSSATMAVAQTSTINSELSKILTDTKDIFESNDFEQIKNEDDESLLPTNSDMEMALVNSEIFRIRNNFYECDRDDTVPNVLDNIEQTEDSVMDLIVNSELSNDLSTTRKSIDESVCEVETSTNLEECYSAEDDLETQKMEVEECLHANSSSK